MSVEVNDRKRYEMGQHIHRLRNLGWTTPQLAAWMGVSPSTIDTWGRSASMGTNAQRHALKSMRSPAEERPRIEDAVRGMRQEADLSEGKLLVDEEVGARHILAYRRARIARIRARADALTELFNLPKEGT